MGSANGVGIRPNVLEQTPKHLYIGGEWCDARGQARLEVEDPATGEPLCQVPDASVDDARAAIDAAAEAQEQWAQTPPSLRSEVLRRSYELLKHRGDELALLLTLEMGKPVKESLGEVLYGAEFFRWFAGEALRIDGYHRLAADGASRLLTTRMPVGPSYLITPWNFPAAMGARKIAPALAAGCTMVWKPAQQTPLSALALAKVLEQAGLPPGVLNVIVSSSSRAVSEPIISDPRLRKLSFTGSTRVGRELMRHSASNVLRVSMELGGNAPFVVFEDADLDAAIEGAVVAKMRNGGQACTAANRFLVQKSIAREFSERLTRRIKALQVGPGTDSGVEIGPLIDAAQRNKVAELVTDAVDRGAQAVTGGRELDRSGNFYAPTVLTDVPPRARLLREEIFGPVAPIVAFADQDEAVTLANDTEYGLVGYLYTRDIGRALRVADRLDVGMVGLNRGLVSNAAAPFGGVKASGIGREGGREGLAEFLETKYLAIDNAA